MNMKRIDMILPALLIAASCFSACAEQEEYVPPRKEKPGSNEPVVEKFNDIGIEAHVEGEPYDTYEGLVMAGYQGWHAAKGDSSPYKRYAASGNESWAHYSCHTNWPSRMQPGAIGNAFSFWPDCSEYEKKYEAETFKMADGSPAYLYSSWDESTVLTHFRWMQEYGIDGAFAQRFIVYTDRDKNEVEYDMHWENLKHQMKASNEYGRAICVMYDLVGLNDGGKTVDTMFADLDKLEQTYHFKDRSLGQKYYLYHNGKPLVAVVSFAQMDMPYDMTECREVVERLQERGYSVMIGVPTYWRDGGVDSPYTYELTQMIRELHPDILMPWYTGRFDYKGTAHTYKASDRATSFDVFKERIKADSQWCKDNGVLFAPNCWPGFDWSHQYPASLPYDRYGGDFMWAQAYYEVAVAGVHSFYIGMYDEIDEGTAIFKMCRKSDAPSNV